MIDAVFSMDGGAGRRSVRLDSYLDAATDERATGEAIAWIKSLRLALVDGVPLRRRFDVRDDSLWWFAELYLHKQQVILKLFRALAALEALIERERPGRIELERGDLNAARQCFQRAVAIDPQSSQAHAGLGVVAMKRGDRQAAIAAWQKAVELDATNCDALYNLAPTLVREGRTAEARPFVDRFVRTAPPAFYAKDIQELSAILRR